jgi:hypothetical protein
LFELDTIEPNPSWCFKAGPDAYVAVQHKICKEFIGDIIEPSDQIDNASIMRRASERTAQADTARDIAAPRFAGNWHGKGSCHIRNPAAPC